jgi:hypothetical protein
MYIKHSGTFFHNMNIMFSLNRSMRVYACGHIYKHPLTIHPFTVYPFSDAQSWQTPKNQNTCASQVGLVMSCEALVKTMKFQRKSARFETGESIVPGQTMLKYCKIPNMFVHCIRNWRCVLSCILQCFHETNRNRSNRNAENRNRSNRQRKPNCPNRNGLFPGNA